MSRQYFYNRLGLLRDVKPSCLFSYFTSFYFGPVNKDVVCRFVVVVMLLHVMFSLTLL